MFPRNGSSLSLLGELLTMGKSSLALRIVIFLDESP